MNPDDYDKYGNLIINNPENLLYEWKNIVGVSTKNEKSNQLNKVKKLIEHNKKQKETMEKNLSKLQKKELELDELNKEIEELLLKKDKLNNNIKILREEEKINNTINDTSMIML